MGNCLSGGEGSAKKNRPASVSCWLLLGVGKSRPTAIKKKAIVWIGLGFFFATCFSLIDCSRLLSRARVKRETVTEIQLSAGKVSANRRLCFSSAEREISEGTCGTSKKNVLDLIKTNSSSSPPLPLKKKKKLQPSEARKSESGVLGKPTENVSSLYVLGRVLGKGQFGTTRLAEERSTGRQLACKSIPKRKLTTPDDVEDVRREVQIMHHLKGYPHVVTLHGAYEDKHNVHLVMVRLFFLF